MSARGGGREDEGKGGCFDSFHLLCVLVLGICIKAGFLLFLCSIIPLPVSFLSSFLRLLLLLILLLRRRLHLLIRLFLRRRRRLLPVLLILPLYTGHGRITSTL